MKLSASNVGSRQSFTLYNVIGNREQKIMKFWLINWCNLCCFTIDLVVLNEIFTLLDVLLQFWNGSLQK